MIGLLSRTAAGVVLMCLVASSFAAASSGGETAPRFVVTSTLDGKSVLPHRIRWRAQPSLPVSQVSRVEFLIDGKVGWDEENAPYTYGDDSNWLVTSWLSPGRHRFTVASRPRMEGRLSGRQSLASWPRTAADRAEGILEAQLRGRYLGSHRRRGRLEDPRSVRGYQLHRRRLLRGRATPGARRDLHKAEQQGRGQRLVPGQERACQLPLDRRGRHAHPHALRSRPLHRWVARPRSSTTPGTGTWKKAG